MSEGVRGCGSEAGRVGGREGVIELGNESVRERGIEEMGVGVSE